MTDAVRTRPSYPRLVVGLAVIALGIAFTLDNLHLVDVDRFWHLAGRYWPVVLIAIGAANIYQSQTWTGFAGGLIWLFVGGWLLGETLGIIHASIWALWPLALVLFGAWVLLNGIRPAGSNQRGAAPSADTVGAVAVMSGVTRRSVSRDFRGGDVIAVMGGATIDLRGADIESGEARLEVFACWGGIDVLVPDGWAIENRVLPFMGGVEDRTARPASETPPRLVVRGLVIMGGLEIRHDPRARPC